MVNSRKEMRKYNAKLSREAKQMSKQMICLSVKLTPNEYEVLARLLAMASSDPSDVDYKEVESIRLKVEEARDNELIRKSLNGHDNSTLRTRRKRMQRYTRRRKTQ
jgi:hypothetical protein